MEAWHKLVDGTRRFHLEKLDKTWTSFYALDLVNLSGCDQIRNQKQTFGKTKHFFAK